MAGENVVYVTVTDFTTIHDLPTGFTTLTSPKTSVASTPAGSLQTSAFQTITASSTLTSPSATAAPSVGDVLKQPRTAVIASLVLAGVIIIGLIYVGVVAFMFWSKYKGKCPKCDELTSEIRRFQKGDPISKHVVRARERASAVDAIRDAEEGGRPFEEIKLDSGTPDSQHQIKANRATALANLEGRGAVMEVKDIDNHRWTFFSFLTDHKRRARRNAKLRAANPDPQQDGSQDRYFTVQGPEASSRQSTRPPPPPPPKAYSPSSFYSSNYRAPRVSDSPPGDLANYPTYAQYYSEASDRYGVAGPATPYPMEQIDPTDALAQQYRQACYDAGREGNPHREEARRTVVDLRERIEQHRRRSRAYGGLPPLSPPRVFGDIDIDGKTGDGEQTWAAKAKGLFGGR